MKKSFLILYTRTRDGRIGRMEEREDGDYMAFSVYGTFTEPEKGVNFVIIRTKPSKRDAFPRKLETAINALVQPWYKEEDRHHDKNRKRYGSSETKCWWNVDGEGVVYVKPDGVTLESPRLWDTKAAIRFEWDGEGLRRVK